MSDLEVISQKEAASMLGVHHTTVRKYIARGLLQGFLLPGGDKRPRYMRVVKASVLALQQSCLKAS